MQELWEEFHGNFRIVVYIDPALPNSTCVEAFDANGNQVLYEIAPGLRQRERHVVDHAVGASYFQQFGTAGLLDMINDLKDRLDRYA